MAEPSGTARACAVVSIHPMSRQEGHAANVPQGPALLSPIVILPLFVMTGY